MEFPQSCVCPVRLISGEHFHSLTSLRIFQWETNVFQDLGFHGPEFAAATNWNYSCSPIKIIVWMCEEQLLTTVPEWAGWQAGNGVHNSIQGAAPEKVVLSGESSTDFEAQCLPSHLSDGRKTILLNISLQKTASSMNANRQQIIRSAYMCVHTCLELNSGTLKQKSA